MFLSDALKTVIAPDQHEAIPEFESFASQVTQGLAASPATKLTAIVAAMLLKQLTVWDRLAIRAMDPASVSRVLEAFEQPQGYQPELGSSLLVTRQPVSRGVLENAVRHVSRDELFGVLPAPRGLLVFVLEDVDDVVRALRMQEEHPEATFSTVVLSSIRLSEMDRLRSTLDDLPHRVAGWMNSTALGGQEEVVSVIATGSGAYEI